MVILQSSTGTGNLALWRAQDTHDLFIWCRLVRQYKQIKTCVFSGFSHLDSGFLLGMKSVLHIVIVLCLGQDNIWKMLYNEFLQRGFSYVGDSSMWMWTEMLFLSFQLPTVKNRFKSHMLWTRIICSQLLELSNAFARSCRCNVIKLIHRRHTRP